VDPAFIAALGAALAQQTARQLRGWSFRTGRKERAKDFQAFKAAEAAYVRKYGQEAFRAQLGVNCEGCGPVEAQRRAFARWRELGGTERVAAAPQSAKLKALEPFQPGPPPALSGADLKRVEAGESVTTTVKTEGGGARAMAVFDVPAAPDAVWAAVQDLPKYPALVSGVLNVQVYDGPRKSGSAIVSKAKFTAGAMGYKLNYHLEMKYEPNLNSLTFELDPSKENDFHGMIGKWHVAAIEGPDGRMHSRVTYQTALQLAVPLPQFIQDTLIKSTLGKAISWVAPEAARREAE
jgi:ribosome-associated toxin RatA of RatAB toxin-antitoxin module